jgi:hypothetical protein
MFSQREQRRDAGHYTNAEQMLWEKLIQEYQQGVTPYLGDLGRISRRK